MKSRWSKIFLLILLTFFSPQKLSAQNWFPLDVGNEWQYIQIEHYQDLTSTDTTGFYVELVRDNIIKDTTISGVSYYKRSLFPDSWYRYSNDEQKIFIWEDNIDHLIMDFTLPLDSFFISYIPQYGEVGAFVNEGDYILFDTVFSYKGYEWILLDYFLERNKFVNNYGIVDYFYNWIDNVLFLNYRLYRSLIQCNINGINYSDDEPPDIVITPITKVSHSNFNLTFSVDHPYNVLLANPSFPYVGLNFIDSVYMSSFYSKGSIVVSNPIVYAENVYGTDEWEISTMLDTSLMSDEYNFNYRIKSIDKGLVPHISFAPDTGYFIAVYDTTSNIGEETEILSSFELYQNYPNPFNPTTKIKYTIPNVALRQAQSDIHVTLKIYDVLGNEIATLVNEEHTPGVYEVEFNIHSDEGQNLPSGIYFYQIKAGSFIETKKMILVK